MNVYYPLFICVYNIILNNIDCSLVYCSRRNKNLIVAFRNLYDRQVGIATKIFIWILDVYLRAETSTKLV